MEIFFNELYLVAFFVAFTSINGCGVVPSQQGRIIKFEVTGFKLPAAMAFSVVGSAPSQIPTISTSEQQAVTFVQNIVMRSIENILYEQGHGAGLSDDLITLILNQLDITVQYKPLKCDIIFINQDGAMIVMPKMTNCQIIGSTVTKTCSNPTPIPPNQPPQHYTCMGMLEDINAIYLSISGSITTTNLIMANWSTQSGKLF